jgi:cyclopropane fatty-acyl-phospholipid synthase-like methyltransferase
VVVDLGSGDGVLLIAAAKRGAHAIGYELSGSVLFLLRSTPLEKE